MLHRSETNFITHVGAWGSLAIKATEGLIQQKSRPALMAFQGTPTIKVVEEESSISFKAISKICRSGFEKRTS